MRTTQRDLAQAPILHADADAFFAAVEQRDDPALRGRPVIAGGGVAMAASYEARRHGLRSAMPGGRARALCPDAIVVTPRWEAYVEAGRAMFAIFERSAPTVQRLSMEESFDLRGSPLTLLAVTVANLDGDPRQLTLAVDDTLSSRSADSG